MELKNFIWKFVSKDKFKPAMCGVYMDPEEKAAVATDAHVMLVCHGKTASVAREREWRLQGSTRRYATDVSISSIK